MIFNTKAALPALKIASGIIARNSTIPLFQSLSLRADGKHLYLEACNSFTGVSAQVQETDEVFQVFAPAKLAKTLELLGDESQIFVSKDRIKILSGKTQATMQLLGLEPNEIDLFPTFNHACEGVKIPIASFVRGVAVTGGTPSKNVQDRFVVTKVADHIQIKSGGFASVGLSDDASGNPRYGMIALYRCELNLAQEILIPAVQARYVPLLGEYVEVWEKDNRAYMKFGNIVLFTSKVSGSFPAWDRLLDAKIASEYEIEREAMGRFLLLANQAIKTGINNSQMSIMEWLDKQIILTYQTPEDIIRQEFEVSNVPHKPIRLGFHTEQLHDALTVLRGGKAYFGILEDGNIRLRNESGDTMFFTAQMVLG